MDLDFDSHFILSIFGIPRSGKSHCLKYIIYKYSKMQKFDHMLLFTNTSFNNQYEYIPDDYIHPAYDENVIHNYMEFQKQQILEGKESRALIVFDDCLGSEEQFASKKFLTLISQYRQFHISIIICSQSVSAIPLNIRNMSQYVILFRYESKRAIEACFESFGVLCHDWKDFKELLLKATDGKHKFLYYNRDKSIEGRDKAYKSLKCPAIEEFKLDY